MKHLRNVRLILLTLLTLLTFHAIAADIRTLFAAPRGDGPASHPISGQQHQDTPINAEAQPMPGIRDIETNLSNYPAGKVPAYEKLEITFQIDSAARNLQLPYDESPPPGIEPGIGISVDALFTPDNWQTVYTQPAFYFQDFEDEIRGNREWFYPTDDYSWKVRFSPHEAGVWAYKLVARDKDGVAETIPQTFSVAPSGEPGFVRVSADDSRYFEFDNGSYFPGLGYNMNFDHISWNNPVLQNEDNFRVMEENGIQLVRMWLSQWGIFSSAWNPWNAIEPDKHGSYIPATGVTSSVSYRDSEVSMQLRWDSRWYSSCMFTGFMKMSPAVKRNANYRVRVRYKAFDIEGPRIAGSPYGFVAKTGGWLWNESGESRRCYNPGTGAVLAASYSGDWESAPDPKDSSWMILEGNYASKNRDFMENFYLALENVTGGAVYIDYVWIEEELGDGRYGPNIINKPWMAHHQYFEQRASYAFDKVVELAGEYNTYLRPVILEKNEWIQNAIDSDGDFSQAAGNNNFYGDLRQVTKVRWLQQAWWRYLQARWGYSPNIQSWELLNEGDPNSGRHYALADEFGKYMKCTVFGAPTDSANGRCDYRHPNRHLISTSTWTSFPRDDFWANPDFPNLDFADLHRYIPENDADFADSAQATNRVSQQVGALQPGGAGKPVIRGETGFVVSGSSPASEKLLDDVDGIWLHNLIWGGINSGGLIESYWYENRHIYGQNNDGGVFNFDYRDQFGPYYNFIKDIPLNNGHYQDAQAQVSNESLRAWGQKDLTNGSAHLWIQNTQHTWLNIVEGVNIPPQSGTITITGFTANTVYTLQWWDAYQADSTQQILGLELAIADANGAIRINIDDLVTDTAIKIAETQPLWSVYLPYVSKINPCC